MDSFSNSYDFCQIILRNQIRWSSLKTNSSLKKESRVSVRKEEQIKIGKENRYVPEVSKRKDYKTTVKKRYELLSTWNATKITIKEKFTWVVVR